MSRRRVATERRHAAERVRTRSINCGGVGVDHLSRGALAVEPAALLRRAERAVRNARRAGEPVLLGVTTRLPGDVDPSALAFASRRPGEDWFCFEQPDRDGAALAALGCVTAAAGVRGRTASGALAAEWRALAADAVADAPDGPRRRRARGARRLRVRARRRPRAALGGLRRRRPDRARGGARAPRRRRRG